MIEQFVGGQDLSMPRLDKYEGKPQIHEDQWRSGISPWGDENQQPGTTLRTTKIHFFRNWKKKPMEEQNKVLSKIMDEMVKMYKKDVYERHDWMDGYIHDWY